MSQTSTIRPLAAANSGGWPYALAVTSAAEARRNADVLRPTHLISISDPDRIARGPESVPPDNRLAIAFEDVEDPSAAHAITLAQVEQILAWVRALPADARVLVHCLAGESRSPAVATGILAEVLGSKKAAAMLRELRPAASPNRLVLSVFDTALGLSRTLVRAVVDEFGGGGPKRRKVAAEAADATEAAAPRPAARRRRA